MMDHVLNRIPDREVNDKIRVFMKNYDYSIKEDYRITFDKTGVIIKARCERKVLTTEGTKDKRVFIDTVEYMSLENR